MDDLIKEAIFQQLAEPSFIAKLRLLGWNDSKMIPLFTIDYGDRANAKMYITIHPKMNELLIYWSDEDGGGGGWTEDQFKEDYQITSK